MLRQIQTFLIQYGEPRLIQAARNGNREAFDRLLRSYEGQLRGFLQSRVGYEAMEDVMQETLIACWQGLPHYANESRFRTWLFGIARHKCLDYHRSRQRHATRILPLDESAGEIADTKNLYAKVDAHLWVTALLESLPAEQKEVMELYYYGELTIPEVAALLGRNLSTVKAQFYRGHLRASAQVAASDPTSVASLPHRNSGGA